ncbi:hypothetical protein BH10ACT1_BH10ACT1_30900 [soil metagenome]
MQERTIGQRWRSTTLPYLAMEGVGQASEFVGWILLARRLGTETFGELMVAVLACRYAGLIADWGASISGVRDVAEGRHPRALRALERRRILAATVLSAAYLVGAGLSGHGRLMPLVVMILCIGLNRDWIALGREQGARSGLPALVQGLTMVSLALVSTAGHPEVAPSVAYGCGLVLSLALNRLPRLRPQDEEADAPAPVDGWMLVAVLANQVLSTTDTFLIALLLTASKAGIYSAVYRLPNGWLALLVILRGGLLPLATSVRREHPEQFAGLRRSSLRWSAGSAAVLLALIPLSYVAIPRVFGHAYDDGRWPAAVLLLATALATLSAPLHHLYLAFGNDRPYAGYLVWAAILNIGLNLAAIPTLGLVGAAGATLVANAFLAAALWRGLRERMTGLSLTAAGAAPTPRPVP